MNYTEPTRQQLADSKKLLKMIKEGIDTGKVKMKYIDFLIEVGEMVEIVKADKIKLIKYFRNYTDYGKQRKTD